MDNPFSTLINQYHRLDYKLDLLLNKPKEELNQKLYTVKESSLFFKVSELTVRKRIKAGEIKAFKIGGSVRIKHEEIFNSLQEVKSIKYKRKAK